MTLEMMEKRKRTDLMGFTVFFSLWQIGHMANLHFEAMLSPLWTGVFTVILMVGVIGYLCFTYRFMRTHKMMKQDPKFCAHLNDERARHLRAQAMSYGFIASIGVSGLLFAGLTVMGAFGLTALSGTFVAHAILVITIVACWASFLVLDSE